MSIRLPKGAYGIAKVEDVSELNILIAFGFRTAGTMKVIEDNRVREVWIVYKVKESNDDKLFENWRKEYPKQFKDQEIKEVLKHNG